MDYVSKWVKVIVTPIYDAMVVLKFIQKIVFQGLGHQGLLIVMKVHIFVISYSIHF